MIFVACDTSPVESNYLHGKGEGDKQISTTASLSLCMKIQDESSSPCRYSISGLHP